MAAYREFREKRLADPAFRVVYERYCSVCRTTMEIVGHIHREGCSMEEVAARAGVPLGDVADLSDAERCDPRVVRRLCTAFGVKPPASCPFEA